MALLLTTLKSQMLLLPMMILLLGLTTSITAHPGTTLPEVLLEFGFPVGLFPDSVKSFSLSDDGQLEVELYDSCSVLFESRLIAYRQKITAKLQYGSLSDIDGILDGIQFPIWPPRDRVVRKIWVDLPPSDKVYFSFYVGSTNIFVATFNVDEFATIPSCLQPNWLSGLGRKAVQKKITSLFQ